MSRLEAKFFSGNEASPTLHGGLLSGDRALFRRVVRILRHCSDRRRQRRALAGMEEHRLRDIGKSRAEALREVRKWFWEP